MNKEEAAQKYVDWLHKEIEEYYGRKCEKKDMQYGNGDIKVAFITGWEEAINNLWTDVNEKLPDDGVKVLVLTKNKKIVVSFRYKLKDISGNILDNNSQWNGSKSFGQNIIAWMPIPSFDEILESNKDVLQRLKYK